MAFSPAIIRLTSNFATSKNHKIMPRARVLETDHQIRNSLTNTKKGTTVIDRKKFFKTSYTMLQTYRSLNIVNEYAKAEYADISKRKLSFTVASFLISLAAHDIPTDFRFTASQKRFNHRSDKLHNNPLKTNTGGIANSKGRIEKSKEVIANSKGGIAKSKGSIANSKEGIEKSEGSIANSKGRIAKSKGIHPSERKYLNKEELEKKKPFYENKY
uniref:Uncharacterized protein n=1 Tax=Glossina pallidipes TaxID=7398 RepID=A0A1A9ZH08_GLOPL